MRPSLNTDTSLARNHGTAKVTKRPRISKITHNNCHNFQLRSLAHLRDQNILAKKLERAALLRPKIRCDLA